MMCKTWSFLLLFWVVSLAWAQYIKNRDDYYLEGGNVCSNTRYETATYPPMPEVSHTMETRKTSCGLFGWSRCTTRRKITKTLYVIKTGSVAVRLLSCCPGWRSSEKTPKVCDTPICTEGCGPNGGKCVAPDTCKCKAGWTGTYCERDINECDKNNGNCQQTCTNTPGSYKCGCSRGYVTHRIATGMEICIDFDECENKKEVACRCANIREAECNATCINTIGSYRCSCNKGYRLIAATVCEDIDECLSPITNNCNLKCINLPGSYSCHCSRGFILGKDGATCKDEDECKTKKGCQHMCLNTYGSFRCRCRRGFKLHANRRQCIDIDECVLFNPCEMKCSNVHGSYFCSCPDGYKLNKDNFTCSDVDECSEAYNVTGLAPRATLSDCEQLCINIKGSFRCSCKRGYRLQKNEKACEDVDECDTGTHRCEQNCKNVIGSYVCSCGAGYRLKLDKRTCQALPCESIERPVHGSMKCDGLSTGSRCRFQCDPQYDLFGSEERICLPSGKWNGTRVTCEVKHCPKLGAPENAQVLLPCHNTLNSRCTLECDDGFHSRNGGIGTCELDTTTGYGEWNLRNFQCKELQLCNPNPCQNGGKCSMQNKNFYCDCGSTGFEGPRCQTGIITTPIYQRLRSNKESEEYHLYAQPRDELMVTIRSTQAVVVKPQSQLQISKSSRKATFTLVPKRPGLHIISYTLNGEDAKAFKVPKDNTIFVGLDSVSKDSVYTKLQISEGSLPEGCHELPQDLFHCKARLTSTLPWGSPSGTSTEGIVHLGTTSFKIPISLFGTDLNRLSTTREQLLSKIERFSAATVPDGLDLSFMRNGKCRSSPMKMDYLFELIQSDALSRSMFRSLSRSFPRWIQFQLDQDNDVFDVTNLMVSVGKPISDGSGMCEGLPISTASMFFKPSITFIAKIDGEIKKFQSKERACFALDACQSKSFVDLSSPARKRFMQMKIFKDMKTAGWDFQVSSFGMQNHTSNAPIGKSNYDIWMKGETSVLLSSPHLVVHLNKTGVIFTKSDCPHELLSKKFSCSLSGSFEGSMSMQTSIKPQNSELIPLKLKSDNVVGKYVFGGLECKQGINITLTSLENPVKGTILSPLILPYLKYPMNVTINHDIGGGGNSGVRIPNNLVTTLMLLGFIMQQFQFTAQTIPNVVPNVGTDVANLLKIVNDVNAIATKTRQLEMLSTGKTLVNQEAQNLVKVVRSLEQKIEDILTKTTLLSQKLSSHTSNPVAHGIKAQLQGFKTNLELSAKSLTLDIERSPIKQSLKGLSIGMMSQVCIGRLCVPYVKATLLTNNEETTSTMCPMKNKNPETTKRQSFLSVLVSPSKDIKLGRLLHVKEGELMTMDVYKGSMHFKSTMTLFGMKKVVNLNITDQHLDIKVKGNIFNKFQSEINITATTKVDDWDSLIFKASGRMGQDSRIPRMLEQSVNQHAYMLARKAENRIEKARKLLESAVNKTQHVKSILTSKKYNWDLSRKNKKNLETILKKRKVAFYEDFSRFESSVKDHEDFKRKLLNQSCSLVECKRLCSKTCIPDMCWDRAIIQYEKHDCFKVFAKVIKFVPGEVAAKISYPTTPTIRRDVGKCKSFLTALGEGLIKGGAKLLVSTVFGKRRKRSLLGNQKFDDIPDFNKLLKKSDPSLPRDFDLNDELKKLSKNSKLPKDFDINKLMSSYFIKQHKFDPSEILKEHFPALPADFDMDEELMKAVPELRNGFDFDKMLKNVIVKAQRSKKRVALRDELEKMIPELRNTDLDRVLKKFSPPLRSLKNITEYIQSSLDDVTSFKVNNALLKRFDVNDIIKTKLRGLHREVDLNTLLQKGIPQLGKDFNLNKLLADRIKLGPANLGSLNLDRLIGGAVSGHGIPNFNLQNTLRKLVPGFAKGLNFGKLIKDKLQDIVSVDINPLKFSKLNFNSIINKHLPVVQDLGINNIIKLGFPQHGAPFSLGKVLREASPVVQMFGGGINLNSIVKGALPHLGNLNLNIENVLKNKIPGLRLGNIEGLLKGKLNEFFNPSLKNILNKFPGLGNIDLPPFLRNVKVGKVFNFIRKGFSGNFFDDFGNAFKNFGQNLAGGIGGIISGAFTSAFTNSGCKKKYVTELGETEYRSYTQIRAIMVPKTMTEVKWHCNNSRMENMTSNGFVPRSCCRKDINCVEFLDPICVQRNQECIKEKRENFKKERSDYNNTILIDYPFLIESEKNLIRTELQLEKDRLGEQTAAQAYRIVRARLQQLQALENASRTALSKMESIPDVDLGLKMKKILDKSYKDRPLRISQFTFHTVTSSLSKSRLPLRGTVTTKAGPDLKFNFIMDFADIHSSINHTAKTIIRKLAQSLGKSRKRRSVEVGISNSSQISDPLKENEKCLLARNISLFYSEILNALNKLLESKSKQDDEISNEIAALDDLEVAVGDVQSSENDLTKNYVDIISSYKEQRNEQSKMVSWNETIFGWKSFVQNITETRNLKDCSTSLDCVEELSERLVEIYSPFSNNTKAKEIQILLPRLANGIKELMEDELPMDVVRSKLRNLTILLNKTYDDNVLCGKKPVMLTNGHKQEHRLIGEKIKLSCLAKSQSKVVYTWRRDNTVIKVDKSGDLELRSLKETSQGLYRCEAANHKGSTFSGITALVIEIKPKIIEHPADVQVPLKKDSGVTFSCVANGKPLPTIKWLFQPLSSNLSVELTNENSNILYVVPDELEKSGHYYCEASNERGKSVSRKARLDVLDIAATNPKIAVIFNATNACYKTKCRDQKRLEIPIRMDRALRTSLTNAVTTSMNVSKKGISNMKYIPISNSTAKIYFFLTERIQLNIKDLPEEDAMEKFAEARLKVVGKLKRIMHALNSTILTTSSSRANLMGIPKTLGFLYMAPDCPQGQYLHDNGYMCVYCPPGSFKDDLEGKCTPCPTGTYQPKPGQAVCITCGQDKTTLQRNTIEESQCTEKELCPPGTFNDVLDDICTKCPIGTYQPRPGQTSCIKCGLLKTTLLQGSINRTQCIQKDVCPPGTFKRVPDKVCTKCPIGTYQSKPGQTSCFKCGPEKTTLLQGANNETQCVKKECPPGTYENKEGNCTKCPPKTYQPQAGQKQCIPCVHSSGPINNVEGRRTCEKQGPGIPRGLLAFSLGSNGLKLLWWKPETGKVSHYELEYGFIAKRPLGTIRVLPGKDWASGESYKLRGLLKYTVYRIKVYTVENNERSKPAIITVRTMDDVPERSPTIRSITAVNATAIKVTWQELPVSQRNGIILGYNVYIKRRSDPFFKKQKVNRRDRLSTVLTNLQENTIYCIKMTAFTRKGAYSHWKRNGCKYARTPRPVSKIFSNVTAHVTGQNAATITWRNTGKTPEGGFVVHYGKQEKNMDQTATCQVQICRILNLEGGTTYYARVRTTAGRSDVSKMVSFTTAMT